MQTNFKSKATEAPLVSVVIPVYQVEKYVIQAVDSVLRQSYQNLEVIVVDDQSPDDSIALVQSRFSDPRIRIIRQMNRGLAGARNTGIRHAKGKYIALLDSDDFWHVEKIATHVRLMETNLNCGVSFCSSHFVNESGESIGRLQAPLKIGNYRASDIFCRNPIGNGSVPVLRASVIHQIGFRGVDKLDGGISDLQYFDENLRQSEDIDCWTRISIMTGTEFNYIDRPLTYYRLNNQGLSANVEEQFATWLSLLENLKGYAPNFAKRYGASAKAFQYRYLARRSVFQGQARRALKFMYLGLKTQPLALLAEFKRTFETLFASLALSILPEGIQRNLLKRLI